MFEELEIGIETKDVAITLKKLVPLFDVVNKQIKDLATIETPLTNLAGKSWVKYQCKMYKKVAKKSVKKILVKNPINIEMPTLKKVGNGQIKLVPEGKKAKDIDEIDIHEALPEIEISCNND